MKTLIQAPVEKPAVVLRAKAWACVVAGLTSRGKPEGVQYDGVEEGHD